MIIRFHNLGKIKETELDLRPMTVIIGPNNSNKTYVAYSVYGLWQALRGSFGSSSLVRHLLPDKRTKGPIVLMVDELLVGRLQEHINSVVQSFEDELEVFFQDSSRKLFRDTYLDVAMPYIEVIKTLSRGEGFRQRIHRSYELFCEIVFEDSAIKLRLLPQNNEELQTVKSSDRIYITPNEASRWIAHFINQSFFSRPILLPAERNAFIIAYKLLGNRRYKLLRESQREAFSSGRNEQRQLELLREAGELRYPQPVEDFLDFLTDVETETSSISNGHKVRSKTSFARLADIIENSIQNANKTRYRPTALGGKEIVANVEKGLDIDLYNASSSIKQLAPLLLYLRYRARENDLLIIDEPEMNLHPESQAKLMEALAMLVNHGVNVLLTTHSPYILAHLNNLAQGQETSQAVKNRQAKSLYLKNPDSLLRMEQVSAYEMRDNQLHSLKEEGYGIRWNTLSDVSVDLQQKYFEIYEEGHAKEKVKATRKTAKAASGQNGQG